MPTRLYLRSNDDSLGAFDTAAVLADSFNAAGPPVFSMGPAKLSTSMATTTAEAIANEAVDALAVFISPPAAEEVELTTGTMTAMVGTTRTGGAFAFPHAKAYVLQSDGSIKGVIKTAGPQGDFNSINTTREARAFASSALSSLTLSVGDRLAVAIGAEAFGDAGGCSVTVRVGDAAGTDISAAGDTDDDAPWIDFPDDMTFDSEGGGGPTEVDLLLDAATQGVTTSGLDVEAAAAVELDAATQGVTTSDLEVTAAAAVELSPSTQGVTTSALNLTAGAALDLAAASQGVTVSGLDVTAAASLDLGPAAQGVTASALDVDAAVTLSLEPATQGVTTSDIDLLTDTGAVDLALEPATQGVTTSSIDAAAAVVLGLEPATQGVTTSAIRLLAISGDLEAGETLSAVARTVRLVTAARVASLSAPARTTSATAAARITTLEAAP